MGLRDLFRRASHVVSLVTAAGRHVGEQRASAGAAAPLPRAEHRDYTRTELAEHDGRDPARPLLLAIRGKVYDVTRGRSFYGPGGPYAGFAGKECARALALDSLEPEDVSGELGDLPPAKLQRLDDWTDTFEMKYGAIGSVIDA